MELFPSPSHVFDIPASWGWIPPAKLEFPRPHWHGEKGDTVAIEIQGNFAAVAFRTGPQKERNKERGKVLGFSASSRLRMFKLINSLDLDRAGRSTFATMTWRDDAKRPTPAFITRARSQMQRSLERLCGRRISGIWRVEWQLRKSGECKDEYMPHIHGIFFDIPWVDKAQWARCWGQAIGTDKRVSVKLEALDCRWKVLNYVAKYVAKEQFSCNLDIPSYLNRYLSGRKWGVYRRDLLPVADKVEIQLPPGPLVDSIRFIAKQAYAKTPTLENAGFCVFGLAAGKILELLDFYLDIGTGCSLPS